MSDELITELSRWQDAIRQCVITLSGAPDTCIDGAGCDSGDPLDLTLAEITQGFSYLADRFPAPSPDIETLVAEARDWLKEHKRLYDGWSGTSEVFIRQLCDTLTAEHAARLRGDAEIEALKRGEFICGWCGIRKDAEGSRAEVEF